MRLAALCVLLTTTVPPSVLLAGCASGPVAAGDADAPGRVVEVQPGQTVYDLSRESGLSVDEILEVNGIATADDLAPGDRVFLPAGRAPVRRSSREPTSAERVEPVHVSGSELSWPLDGVVLRAFSTGKARGGPYDGLLVAAPAGTVVRAAADGRVVFSGEQGTAYGRFVVLEHAGELVTVYAHLEDLRVEAGARVQRGDALGTVGTSGRQETPRLHFQVRRGRTAVDPEPLLPE